MQKLSLNHFSERPADCVTPITCQQSGTAAQQVCTLPFGSITGFEVCANTTPDVPIVVNAFPSSQTPVPRAAAALSPAPPATTTDCSSPNISAISFLRVPVTSQDSYTFGSISISISSKSHISLLQHLFETFNSCIPEASETSVAYSPVRINLR